MECCLPLYLNTEINKRDRKGWERGTASHCIYEYMDIKTDRKSQNREVMWGWIAIYLCI